MARVGAVEPAGSQRAVRNLPVPRGHQRFLSSLTWKLYGASHLWLRPFLASCLSSSRSRQLPALPAHLQPFCPAGSYRPPTKANPEGTHCLSASLCLLLSLLLLLQDLSSFASTLQRKSHISRGMAELHDAGTGDTTGSLSLPTLSAGAGDGQRCLAWPGARDVPGRGGQARAGPLGDAQPDAHGPAMSLPIRRSHHSPRGNKLPFNCAFISPAFFFPLSLNTFSALSDLALLFPAGWGAAAGRWTPRAAQGGLHASPGGRL